MWGAANQVVFDPGKKSVHILHRSRPCGSNFKILGCVFDSQLRMLDAAKHIAKEAGWRLRTLLRTRKYFTTPEMVRLYNAQILSFMESSTPALYHAAPSTLAWIDRVQVRFLKEIDLSEFDALRDYRLAPLKCRRDIAMLGVLHKVNLGTAPPQLSALFPGSDWWMNLRRGASYGFGDNFTTCNLRLLLTCRPVMFCADLCSA